MEATSKETVALINELIVINHDRIEGYERAAKETEDPQLKSLFTSMADESRQFKNELVREVVNQGGSPAEGTTTSGKVYRAWMDIKAALTGKDRHAIIASCEFGEDAALETYEDVLKSDSLVTECRNMITRQKSSLQKSHDKIKLLRDSTK
ncbi:MAG: hypothetical protein K0S44_1222 [Bacteroidetes bacterium]|jgi:uncharacterized protein (TIGR02284 family)|nr:hypothetical protein [Bacteroidota bacterium]